MSRALTIVAGGLPACDVPPLYRRPYKGIPQFDLADLDRHDGGGGPAAHRAGRLLAPAAASVPMTELPVAVRRYAPGPSDHVAPFARAAGAPVDFDAPAKQPLAPARFPRPDPSR